MRNGYKSQKKSFSGFFGVIFIVIIVAFCGWYFFAEDKQSENYDSLAADSYMAKGDFQKAITEYKNLIEKSNSSEEDLTYVKIQLAKSYAALGYYKKALPIFRELKDWYPQELISAYLALDRNEEARNILFSDKVLASIKEGDDIDGVRLHYELLKYFKAMGNFESAQTPFSKDAPVFETEIFESLNLADLYYRQNNLQKFEEAFEKFLTLDSDDAYKLRLQLNYAQLLAKNGDEKHAKKQFSEVKKLSTGYYKYSPEVICSDYYEALALGKSVQKAEKTFQKLKLDDDSLFKNDIKEFCRINMQY